MTGAWHLRTAENVLDELGSSELGLPDEEATRRLDEHGPNSIPTEHRPTLLRIVFDQFRDPLVVVLLVAAILSYLASEVLDSAIILVLVLVNAAIGAGQQIAARRSLRALRAGLPPTALAMRSGRQTRVAAADLVPGDVVLLAQGDRVPADLRLVEASGLSLDESTLTGESLAVDKQVAPVAADSELADWADMCFSSTFVTRGRGVGVVVATGAATQIGRIAGALGGSNPPTPLQRQLAKLGVIAGVGAGAVAAVLFVVGILQGRGLLSTALLAISLAVAAIPEGLVAISALILAGGVRRMAKRGAIVRTLSAVETIGAASVICVDKTGTLTENRMTVVESWEPDATSPTPRLLRVAALCNDSDWSAQTATGVGDPMEVALARWVHEKGLSRVDAETRHPRVSEIPFDSYRKLMTTVHRAGPHTWLVTTKGSVDELLARCIGLDASELDRIRGVHDDFARRGLRILAFADRSADQHDSAWEENLQFIGLVGLEDPRASRSPRRSSDAIVRESRP